MLRILFALLLCVSVAGGAVSCGGGGNQPAPSLGY
jgi:hypothetical protein